MPLDERSAYGLAALATVSLLVLSCVPAMDQAALPVAVGANAAGAAANVPVTNAIQPAIPAPVATKLSAAIEVVVPTGAVIKLQKSLRTQATDASGDFSSVDLQHLVIQLDGRTLLPSEYTMANPTYDGQQQLHLTITFTPPPTKPTPVRIATADGTITLLGQTSATGAPAHIDSHSTAEFLMAQLLVQPQSDADRQQYMQAIEKTVQDTLTSSATRPLNTDAALLSLMQRISAFIATGNPLTPAALSQITTPPALTGGGGIDGTGGTGGAGGNGGNPTGGTSGADPNTNGDPGGTTGGAVGGGNTGGNPTTGGNPSTSGGGTTGGNPTGGGTIGGNPI